MWGWILRVWDQIGDIKLSQVKVTDEEIWHLTWHC
jgi:hypothetical protein